MESAELGMSRNSFKMWNQERQSSSLQNGSVRWTSYVYNSIVNWVGTGQEMPTTIFLLIGSSLCLACLPRISHRPT